MVFATSLIWPQLAFIVACVCRLFSLFNISIPRNQHFVVPWWKVVMLPPKKDRQEAFWSLICYSLHSRSLTFLLLFPDYANSRCQSYDIDTNSRSGRKRLEKDSIVNFFEKICLRGGKNHKQIVQKSNFAKGKGRFAKCQCQFRHGLFCDKKCRNNK